MIWRKGKEKIKKVDVLITSIVLGTIIAGAFGLKRKRKSDHISFGKKILNRLGKK